MRKLLLFLLLASPVCAQWANVSTNALGVRYDASVGLPTDGYSIVYDGALKAYKTALSGGSPTNVPWGGTAAATSSGLQHLGIPLYIYPGASWTTVGLTATKTSLIISNDSSGNPPVQDPNYVAAIAAARTAGLTVICYVPTNYAADSIATVEAKIDKAYTFYSPDGIFFDEVASGAGTVAYYTTLYNYVRAKTGADLVALNPGTTCVEALAAVSDIICTFEGPYSSYLSYVPDTWTRKYNATKFWHIVHDTTLPTLANAIKLTKANGAGWVNITDYTSYGNLATYLALEALEIGYAAGDDVRLPPPPLTAGRMPYDTTTGVTWTATGGTTTQVVHGGSTPAYSKVVVADISSAGATNGQVPTADGASGVSWMTPSGGGGASVVGFFAKSAGVSISGTPTTMDVDEGLTASVTGATYRITPTYGTAVSVSSANSAGVNSTFARSDHVHTIGSGIVTDTMVAAANKDGLAAVASMRTLGTGAQQAMAGNQAPTAHAASHLPGGSDALTTATAVSVGSSNGTGSAASFARSDHAHTIGAGIVTDTMVAAANKDGVAGTASMRTLGTGAQQALPGNQSLSGDVTGGVGSTVVNQASVAFALNGTITPTQITADQNDYNPTGLSTASSLRLSTDASRNITGLAGGATGRIITILNSGSFDLVLVTGSASSSTSNRFTFSNNVTIGSSQAVILQYDGTTTRWRMIGASRLGTTGTGTTMVLSTSPTITTPVLSGTPAGSGAFGFASSEGLIYNSAAHKILTDEFNVNIQTLTASGTYTPTANIVFAIVECVGGGGGSGGVLSSATYILTSGSGGAGGYSRSIISAPASVSYTIGAAGAGGAAGNNNGTSGGNTTFGSSVVVANGGGGSAAVTNGALPAGGAGATVGTGDVTAPGAPGGPGINSQTTNLQMASPTGASGPFGAGGRGANATTGTQVAGSAGTGHGAGGGGSGGHTTTTNAAGANGSAGMIVVTEFIRR